MTILGLVATYEIYVKQLHNNNRLIMLTYRCQINIKMNIFIQLINRHRTGCSILFSELEFILTHTIRRFREGKLKFYRDTYLSGIVGIMFTRLCRNIDLRSI